MDFLPAHPHVAPRWPKPHLPSVGCDSRLHYKLDRFLKHELRVTAMRFLNALCRPLIAWCLLAWVAAPDLLAQPALSELPRAEYYLARELLHAGRTREATLGFEAAHRVARKIGQERWIDSIPPLVMLGECHYQQGNLALALEHYDAALMLVLSHPTWIDELSVGVEQLPPLDSSSNGINWFIKSQPTLPVSIPEAIQISIDPTQAKVSPLAEVVAPVSLVTRLDAMEVMRTLGIAMLRRWQVLGPLTEHSPLADPLGKYFSRNPRQPAPWVNSAWNVLRGLSELPASQRVDAPKQLRSGVLINAKFDYFMSPLALIALAELDAREGKYQSAIVALQDATLLAAQYEQYGLLAEALRELASTAAASQRVELLEPLQQAATWCAKRSLSSQLAALTGAAELAIYAGKVPLTDALLKQAAVGLRLREVELPRMQAHASYVAALQAFSQNRRAVGQSHLQAALSVKLGSQETGAVAVRVFQAQLTLNFLASGALTARVAESLLSKVLAEPAPRDWQNKPLETLATITTSSLPAFERHLELSATQGDPAETLVRMDRLQRQRFYESLPLGGRLFSWRKALTSDPQSLPADVLQALQRGIQRSPQLQVVSAEINDLTNTLNNAPLPLDERQLSTDAKKAFTQLLEQSERLESLLNLQSVSRSTLSRYQLPALNPTLLQQQLAPDDVVLCFVVTHRQVYGAAISPNTIELWQVDQLDAVRNKLNQLLSEIGLVRQAAIRSSIPITSPVAPWRQHAVELRDLLVPLAAQDMIAASKRLIVSPSAQLWYVPFELLPDSGLADAKPWIAARSVAYIPTLGSLPLAFAPAPAIRDTIGIANNFFSVDKTLNEQQVDALVGSVPNSQKVMLSPKLTVPHSQWLGLRADQVWVASDLDHVRGGWETVLMPLGANRQIPLAKMLELPHVAPRQWLLPGLRTSMQNMPQLLDGNDIFLPACTLLTSGTRSAVISRWSVGGLSTQRMLQRTLEELHAGETTADALRRSVIALWTEDFLTANEPILATTGRDTADLTTGQHPLLWSGYMCLGDIARQPPPP